MGHFQGAAPDFVLRSSNALENASSNMATHEENKMAFLDRVGVDPSEYIPKPSIRLPLQNR